MDASSWLTAVGYADEELGFLPMMGRLVLAVVLGGIVGFEREWSAKPLGLRTHILVSLGSCGFCVLVLALTNTLEDNDILRLDPGRVIEGVIGGIGFLGAGAILRQGGDIRGATTGAGIWVVGGIGMAAGFGFYGLALGLTVLTMLVVVGLHGLAHRIGD